MTVVAPSQATFRLIDRQSNQSTWYLSDTTPFLVCFRQPIKKICKNCDEKMSMQMKLRIYMRKSREKKSQELVDMTSLDKKSSCDKIRGSVALNVEGIVLHGIFSPKLLFVNRHRLKFRKRIIKT